MRCLTIAAKNLRRRPVRSLLTAAGLAAAVAAIVSLVGVAESFESSFLALYTQRGADLVVQRRGGAVQLSKGVSLKLGQQIRELPGAGPVIGGLMDMVAFEDRDLFMVIVNGWAPDCPVLERVKIQDGRRLLAGDKNCVMLGRVLAANLGKQAGDTVTVYGQPFQVVGVFESFSVYENGAVFMLLEDLQRQMDRTGQVTGYIVQANPPGDPRAIDSLRANIEALDPEIAATPCAEFVGSLNQMRVTRVMSWVISAVACLMGAFGILNTMAMSVFERRCEIGAFRAMGWRTWRVVLLIVEESLLLAGAGSIVGVAGGFLAIVALAHWHVTSGLVQGDLPLRAVCEGVAMAALMAIVGAAYPALRFARLAPVDALREG
ncbi:MAG TPA: ABC transporter permease [Planctomycetaceae bacterium]|jgi:putative ABC transport system permease protein|nr:ABC transporter permease [Planctomycetaceae bacterium]